MQPTQNPGISAEVQAALQRRAGSAPQLGQVSPQAATANPITPPMNPSDMTSTSTPSVGPKRPSDKWAPQDNEGMVIASLSEYLKNKASLEKEKLRSMAPKVSNVPPITQPSVPQPTPQGINFGSSGSAVMNQQDPLTTSM